MELIIKTDKIRVVGSFGGKGTRLAEYTAYGKAHFIPKSLILVNKRPIVAYQLDILKSIQPSIMVCMNDERHINIFRDYVSNGIIPSLDYKYVLVSYKDLMKCFEIAYEDKHFKGKPILWATGDIWYPMEHLLNLVNSYDPRIAVGTEVVSFSSMEKFGLKVNGNGYVTGIYETKEPPFAIKYPIIFGEEVMPIVLEESRKFECTIAGLIRRLAEVGKLKVIKPKKPIINVNTPLDLKKLEQILYTFIN